MAQVLGFVVVRDRPVVDRSFRAAARAIGGYDREIEERGSSRTWKRHQRIQECHAKHGLTPSA